MSSAPEDRRWHWSKRSRALVYSAITLIALVTVAFLLPVPFVKLSPGPTFDVIGAQKGSPVIVIDGTTTYPTTGKLFMTTVLESGGPRGGLTFVDALTSWFNPADAVLPRELLYPDDMDRDTVQAQQAAMFSSAESDAIGAAMKYLKKPVSAETIVNTVYNDSPADGILEPGDHIRSVNGTEITAPEQVKTLVQGAPVGTAFTFQIDRVVGGARMPLKEVVTSKASPADPARPYLGIGVGTRYEPDFGIDFTLKDVGGPSAGLMFSLGLVDKLSPDDLAKGRTIAGTGTITAEGEVGPIGGIRQKLVGARDAGAELFLAPAKHCAEMAGHVPDGLTVTPVRTLAEAVSAVSTWTSGGTPPACPAS